MKAAQTAVRLLDAIPLEGGTGWRDPATGCRIAACTPTSEPKLWKEYLAGALRSYRQHGLEWVLNFDKIRDGADTTLFFAAVDSDGHVVGGTRVVGPLGSPDESHALVEWEGNPGRDTLRKMIANRLPFGLVEVKSAWTDSHAYGSRALSRALARTAVPIMTLLDVQFIMATSAAHVVDQWRSSGGVVPARIPAATYPNDNYRTKVMWWDRSTIATHAEPEQFKLMCAARTEILQSLSA